MPSMEPDLYLHSPSAERFAAPRVTLAAWEDLAQRARLHRQQGRMLQALRLFRQALVVAEALLRTPGQPVADAQAHACIAALVVSHHNLAELYLYSGAPATAAQHLCDAHTSVLQLTITDAPTLSTAAWRHLRETRAALLQFVRGEEDGGTSAATPTAIAACDQALQCLATVPLLARRALH